MEVAREQVAALVGADAGGMVLTSGGTESDNAAILSAWHGWPEKRHLVVAATEHSAVLEPARRWQTWGGEVTWLGVDSEGRVDLAELKHALRAGKTALVTVMWANNETGVVAPIREIGELAHEAGALFHTDAAQVVGKVTDLGGAAAMVDYLTLSGHKFHAPKGVGALFVSRRVRFEPSQLGGGQERGRRSGTENLPGIVAMGKAAELAMRFVEGGGPGRLREMRDQLEKKVSGTLPGVRVHGAEACRLPNTSSLHFPNRDAAGMLILLDQAGVACTAGSACHSAAAHPSHVLAAMGFDERHAASTLRLSFSRMNGPEDAEAAAAAIVSAARKIGWLLDEASGPVAMG